MQFLAHSAADDIPSPWAFWYTLEVDPKLYVWFIAEISLIMRHFVPVLTAWAMILCCLVGRTETATITPSNPLQKFSEKTVFEVYFLSVPPFGHPANQPARTPSIDSLSSALGFRVVAATQSTTASGVQTVRRPSINALCSFQPYRY